MTTWDSPDKLAVAFEAAWNAHDMQAFAALFEEDATFVNRIGTYWRGREQVVEGHRAVHETIYRDTTIENRVQNVDFLTDDVAVVHVRSTARFGPAMRPGHPSAIAAQFMYVAVRNDGWRIRAASNVALADPATGRLLAG